MVPNLDTFTCAYLECALWSSTDDDGEPFDTNYDITDIAEESINAAIETCREFQSAHAALLEQTDASPSQHGHDFWLTRNGHGAGFWDRGYGEVGDKLTDAAHAYGSSDVYLGDDGNIYLT